MKRIATVLAVLLVSCVGAFAATLGSDDASAASYDGGWTNSSSGGTGFGAWTLGASGASGHFIGDSTANAGGGSGGINVSGESFGLWANNGGTAEAWRSLTGGDLSVGQSIALSLDNGWIENTYSVGIGLQNASGQNLLEFYFEGGTAGYTVNDSLGATVSGLGWSGDGWDLLFTLTDADSYSLDVTPAGGGSTTQFTGDLIAQGDMGVEQFHAWNYSAAGALSGANYDAFINSMGVIPEPATFGLLAIGAGLMYLRKRRA